MSWWVRRAIALFGLATATGILSRLIWPGDPDGPLSAAHLIAAVGFLLAAVLLLMAAGYVFVAVVSGTWKAGDFNPNDYFDRKKRGR